MNAILKAKRVYILGVRSVEPLANFLGYYLNYMFNNVHVVSGFGAGEMFEKIVSVNSSDVVIPPFPSPGIPPLRPRARNTAVLPGRRSSALRTASCSPLGSSCDHVLIAKSDRSVWWTPLWRR